MKNKKFLIVLSLLLLSSCQTGELPSLASSQASIAEVSSLSQETESSQSSAYSSASSSSSLSSSSASSSEKESSAISSSMESSSFEASSSAVSSVAKDGAQFPDDFTASKKKYYASVVGLKGLDLKNALHDILNNYSPITYKAASQALKVIDRDPNNSSNVIEIYTQNSIPAANRDGESSASNLWNKEHVYPQSRGNFTTSQSIGADCHSIHCSDKTTNQVRGNTNYYQFSVGESYSAVPTNDPEHPDSKAKINKAYGYGFEPQDSAKGDCARSVFYMAVMYPNNCAITNDKTQSTDDQLGMLKFLVHWNELDKVDEREKKRNESVYSYQKNYNPFIDAPEWINLIWDEDGIIGL